MKYVSYLRVSTVKQGEDGLGIEAQRERVSRFTSECVAEFVEVESGRKTKRPKLDEAKRLCKQTGATLVVAKLDRLARDAVMILGLQKEGVKFVCLDYPGAGELTIGLMAVIAEDEAKKISERTRAAMGVLKARGVKLGSARSGAYKLSDVDRQKACTANRQRAEEFHEVRLDFIRRLRSEGLTLAAIADRLNARGEVTQRGKKWSAVGVLRLLERSEASVA